MTRAQAKAILSTYRSTALSEDIPEVAEALRMAESEEELKAFLEKESAFDKVFSSKVASITPPADLFENILQSAVSQKEEKSKISRFLHPALFGIAASIIIFLALSFTFWNRPASVHQNANPEMSLALKVHTDSKPTLHGKPALQLISYVEERGGMVPSELPKGVTWQNAIACDVVDSPAGKISLICFQKDNTTFHMYTFPKSALPELSKQEGLHFASMSGSCCVSWKTKDSIVFVFAKSTPENIQKSLEI